jgi:hypothetical protein
MTVFYGTQSTKVLSTVSTPSPGFVDGHVKCFAETVTLATQTTSDTIVICRFPKGGVFLGGIITSTVTLGSSTVAIGITGTVAKYKAAATFTAVDTPTFFGTAATINVAETAERTVFITIAAASLPAAGTLCVTMLYATN